MKVKLKASRCLGGVDYKIGTHEMPDSVAKEPYFLAQVANGNALIIEEPCEKAEAPEDKKPEGDKAPEQKPEKNESKKAPASPKIEGETKYQRAKRLKAEKEAKLKEAAGNQEG